jgi:hypothetical protein
MRPERARRAARSTMAVIVRDATVDRVDLATRPLRMASNRTVVRMARTVNKTARTAVARLASDRDVFVDEDARTLAATRARTVPAVASTTTTTRDHRETTTTTTITTVRTAIESTTTDRDARVQLATERLNKTSTRTVETDRQETRTTARPETRRTDRRDRDRRTATVPTTTMARDHRDDSFRTENRRATVTMASRLRINYKNKVVSVSSFFFLCDIVDG